jgi:hypothetical protein
MKLLFEYFAVLQLLSYVWLFPGWWLCHHSNQYGGSLWEQSGKSESYIL